MRALIENNKSIDIKEVNRGIDFDWLISISNSLETTMILEKAKLAYKLSGRDTRKIDHNIHQLSLMDMDILVDQRELPSVLKVFTEIFRENLHCLLPEFYEEDVKTLIDMGANSGFYSIQAARLLPSANIFAFEPNPNSYTLLSKNLLLNGIRNVKTINSAVGSKTETIQIKYIPEASTVSGKYLGNLEKSNFNWIDHISIKTIEVDSISLHDIFKIYEIDILDLVKMDIQNMEYEVLASAKDYLPRIRKIVLEPHHIKTKEQSINLLKKYGFKLVYQEQREHGDMYWLNTTL
jgi:FkbM family methyltransferase